jgi:signal transduction histidine kinase/HAMP domain-containing protein
MTIRQQMIILIVVMTVVPLGIILYSTYNQRTQDIREANLQVEKLAEDICIDQNLLLAGAEQLLSTLSHLPAVRNRDAKAMDALLAELVSKNPQYANLVLVDRTGLQWAAAIPIKGPVFVTDRRYYRSVMASGRFSSGEYAVGKTLKKPVLNFAYPIKDSDGKITDVAVVVFTLENYIERYRLKNIPTGNTSLLLTDHKGTILFNVTAPETIGNQDRADLFRQMSERGGRGTFEAVSNIGIRRYFAYQSLSLAGERKPYMYVRAGMPVETILGKTRSNLLINLGVMTSMLLLAVGFAVYISKRGVIDKVVALHDATREIARGNLYVRVSEHVSGGELGELGNAFDDMALALVIENEERTRHEKELSQYADIVERMQVGLYVYRLEDPADDASLRLVAANPTSVSLLGLSAEEMTNRTIDEIFPALRSAGITEQFAEVVRTGLPFEMEDFIYADENVKSAAFSFKAFPLPDNCVGVLFENISKRKNAETALQQLNEQLEERVQQRTTELDTLNRELEAFSYSVSHDLRAPLRKITGFADILMQECGTRLEEDGLHYVERIRAASQRMNELIEALLKLSRVSRGELNIATVNLSSMAREILNSLQEQEPYRQVTCCVSECITANADPLLMKSLLENLISNAWKYTSKNSNARIDFGATEQEGRSVYFVRDNGVGFNMDYSDNIFAPFCRLHKEEDFKGIGIGLATVQRIINLHGGRIWAESKEGEGATFSFVL